MRFQVIQPIPSRLWDDVFVADGYALATQSRAWVEAIGRARGYRDASRAYEFDNGQTVILPMVRRGLMLSELASLPEEWGFGGAISRKPLESRTLRVVLDDILRSRCMRVYLRPNPATAPAWEAAAAEMFATSRDGAHILDLRGGFADVWSNKFSEKTRNQVRKAEKSGLEIECDRTGALMPVFFELYRESAQRWARQGRRFASLAAARTLARNPLEKFVSMASALGTDCQTWLARHGGRPAAAIIVLRSARHAQYLFGAMDKELAGPRNANDLLHRLAIEDACTAGLATYQMGASGGNKSLIHFKSRFGAREVGFSIYRFERLPLASWLP